jgi:hypothetical protein
LGDPPQRPHKREKSKRLTAENLIVLETNKQTNKQTVIPRYKMSCITGLYEWTGYSLDPLCDWWVGRAARGQKTVWARTVEAAHVLLAVPKEPEV